MSKYISIIHENALNSPSSNEIVSLNENLKSYMLFSTDMAEKVAIERLEVKGWKI